MAFNLVYNNKGVRNLPLSDTVAGILQKAADAAGIDEIRVTSGGQASEGPNRTGSHRHDAGGAGDIQLIKNGRVLSFTDEADLPIVSSFVSNAKAAGATGIGAGEDYMGPSTLHVGLGNPAVWGAGGSSKNAPDWLKTAYGMTLNSNPVTTASATPAASTEPPPTKLETAANNLDDIVGALSPQVDPQVAAAESEIAPSSISAGPPVDPMAAQQMMAQLVQKRRNPYGLSLTGLA